MSIHGIGIDLVEIPRLRELIARQGDMFLRRVFTPAERAFCEARKNAEQHYAGRFAAKEAVAKSFGTGIGKHMAFLEIEVVPMENGAPRIVLHGAAESHAAECGVAEVLLSITHTESYAVANALAVKGA